jgi:hypothetical protein
MSQAWQLRPQNQPKHGHRSPVVTRTYRCWLNLKQRCTNPKNQRYHDYAPRWYEPWTDFEVFLDDVGECPPGLTIDRIKNELPYGPDNVRWATHAEQAQNSVKAKLTAEQVAEIRTIGRKEKGITLAERYGVTPQQISYIRLNKSWRI